MRTMRKRAAMTITLAAVLPLLLPAAGCQYRRDPSPELVSRTEVPVATVPQRTLEAFRSDYPDAQVTSVEHQVARDGSLLYQFEFIRSDRAATAVYDVDGTLLRRSR